MTALAAIPIKVRLDGKLMPALMPAGDFEGGQWEDVFKRSNINKPVLVDYRPARNVKHHRKLFAMLNIVAENSNLWATPEDLLTELKIRARMVDQFTTREGEIITIPRSISFASMAQNDFEKVFEMFVQIICRDLIPNMDENDLLRQVNDILIPGMDQ